MHLTLQHFIHYVSERFKLPQHFKDHGFFIKELSLEKVKTIHEINKNDQLAIMSHHLINTYKMARQVQSGESLLLRKREMPSYFDIFGQPQNINPNIRHAFQKQYHQAILRPDPYPKQIDRKQVS